MDIKVKWKVDIEGEKHPACVWAHNKQEALEQAIELYKPIDISKKRMVVYLNTDC